MIHNRENSIQIQSVSEIAKRVISEYRFDPLVEYAEFAASLEEGQPVSDVFENLQMDIRGDIEKNGGSDCFGLALKLAEEMRTYGYSPVIIPFDTKGLAEEASEILEDVGHIAVGIWDEYQYHGINIFDLGFALGEGVRLTAENSRVEYVSADGRKFIYTVDWETGEGLFEIKSDYYLKKSFGFSINPLEKEDLEGFLEKLQKNYWLRIRPMVSCDRFDDGGERNAGIKTNIINETITVYLGEKKTLLSFQNWIDGKIQVDINRLARDLNLSEEELRERVNVVVCKAGQLRQLLAPSLQQKYLERNNFALRNGKERNWKKLKEEGYDNGGVLALITDGNGRIALYRISERNAKPFIQRFAGQLNTLVETVNKDGQGNPIENFDNNLSRGIQEELGDSMENLGLFLQNGSYREMNYGSSNNGEKTLARCCILQVENPEIINNFKFADDNEGKEWKWYFLEDILGLDIESNLRSALKLCIAEGIL